MERMVNDARDVVVEPELAEQPADRKENRTVGATCVRARVSVSDGWVGLSW
jgi:hypothetical protein